ncbi:DUF4013 domain-containing protein [Halorubrum sp. HHNYT27]|uniref:DUF4013 domain-containing protein n=1 Tax=Halorubrum sp. HHNYT27 TaxID=3402275 RepID=UPI003EC06DEC
MLRGAASALSRSADSGGVLAIGGLLTLLTWVVTPVWILGVLSVPLLLVLAPLALAPAFVARGYFVRVVADAGSTGNHDGAPPFIAWNQLYRDGVKSTLLSALLLAPLALLLAVAVIAAIAAEFGLVDLGPAAETAERALGPGGGSVVVAAAVGLLAVVAAVYLFVFAYVRPAALAVFAASGRLRDAVRPGRIAAVAGSGSYATAWIVAVATLGAGYAFAAPFVPLVVGVVFAFVVRIAAHALYGRGAAGTVDFGAAGPVETGEAADRTGSTTAVTGPLSDRVERAPDRLDGGVRSSISEVTPAVQTGRTVPFDDGRGVPTDADGFRWNAEREFDDGGASDERADSERALDDAFEWGTRVDSENKS